MEKVLEDVRVMLERCFQRPVGFTEAQYVYRQMKEIFESEAAKQGVQLTGGILPASKPLSPPTTGTGIEYLKHSPTCN